MPRISITVSDRLMEYLEGKAASESRSVSAQAAWMIEDCVEYIGFAAIRDQGVPYHFRRPGKPSFQSPALNKEGKPE